MSSRIDDFKKDGLWVRTVTTNGKAASTLSYAKWNSMLNRCRPDGACQREKPTYIGCLVSDEFKDFQTFADWHTQQVGYGLGYDLDKDILVENNKVYSKNTCVLIPASLNRFLCDSGGSRGNLPQGISWSKLRLKFQVHLKVSAKSKYLGLFPDLNSAKLAYKEAKEDEALRWYERLKNGEFGVDERVIERMRVWRFNG